MAWPEHLEGTNGDRCNMSIFSMTLHHIGTTSGAHQVDFGLLKSRLHHEVPHDICVKLKSLIDEHKRGRDRSEENNAVFFSTFLRYDDRNSIPGNFMKEWKDAKRWFEGHAHVRKSIFGSEVNAEIAKHFQTLENFLNIAAGSQYERIRELDEILDETNR